MMHHVIAQQGKIVKDIPAKKVLSELGDRKTRNLVIRAKNRSEK